MRTIFFGCAASILTVHLCFGQITVLNVKGDVHVRHDVSRVWQSVRAGDVLKPHDSMRSGKRASATVLVDGKKRVLLTENMIVDLSDFRSLTQEELLLRLTVERVRAVPMHDRDTELLVPQTTLIHGAEKASAGEGARPDQIRIEVGILQLNGTRLLYTSGYYATCALKAKEVFRLYPELLKNFDARLMVASALENENLNGEALVEYTSLINEQLSPNEQVIVQTKIARLKKKTVG